MHLSRALLASGLLIAIAAHPAIAVGQQEPSAAVAVPKNPVAPKPLSIETGRKTYAANCAACHGNQAQGAVKAGLQIALVIEEQKGRPPQDLTDDVWDHGASDGQIFTVIKRGLPPTLMAGFDGRLSDNDIWNIVNYLRTLHKKK
jgi:mono/diheme cytochrome c family protein